MKNKDIFAKESIHGYQVNGYELYLKKNLGTYRIIHSNMGLSDLCKNVEFILPTYVNNSNGDINLTFQNGTLKDAIVNNRTKNYTICKYSDLDGNNFLYFS